MARDGSIGPQMPTGPGANVNESTPREQRVADKGLPLSDGPKMGDNGEYLPARYERVWTDSATGKQSKVIVEDR
jgi:hypothetical protein